MSIQTQVATTSNSVIISWVDQEISDLLDDTLIKDDVYMRQAETIMFVLAYRALRKMLQKKRKGQRDELVEIFAVLLFDNAELRQALTDPSETEATG